MQKKTAKKLVLSKETVLKLEAELKDVRGGWSSTCTCSFTCNNWCPRMPETTSV